MIRTVVFALLPLLCGLPVVAQHPALDTVSVGHGRYAAMQTLLEKTIFKVDVLTLDVRFGSETAHRLEQLVTSRRYSESLADSIASVAIDARDAWARLRFKRRVSLDQFLNGIRHNLTRARQAGIIDSVSYASISQDLPVWYHFLADDGISKGDEMLYRIRGDTLHTAYRTAAGKFLLEQTDTGSDRRLSVLGGYFAPKSEFRKGLIKSLFGT
jgi:hypothetical protein